MTTPTDVTYTPSTTVISSTHMNGINDWVFGAYTLLGETFTATAMRTAIGAAASADWASGSFTTASLTGSTGTEEDDITHGLGTDDIDFGVTLFGNHATVGYKTAVSIGLVGADYRYMISNSASGALPVTIPAGAGKIRYLVNNLAPSAQTVTVKWWARKR